jgi:uncharacterized small protein (DUF1192 family)
MRQFLLASATVMAVVATGQSAHAVQEHHLGSTGQEAVAEQPEAGQFDQSRVWFAQGAAGASAAPMMMMAPGLQGPGGGCMMPMMPMMGQGGVGMMPMMGQGGMGMMGAMMPMMGQAGMGQAGMGMTGQGMTTMTPGAPQAMSAMSAQGMGLIGGVDRIEGRIAFLRAEIGITDAQGPAWDAFAQAVRSAAAHVGASNMPMNGADGPVTLAQGLEAQDVTLSARLDDVKALRSSLAQLYETLSDDQRKAAEDLIPIVVGAVVAG